MATINQLVSEIAHSLQQPNSVPVRRAIKLAIIHARNELIRKGFNNHHITDKVIQQRFKVELIDVPDGDLANTESLGLITIKRTNDFHDENLDKLSLFAFFYRRSVFVEAIYIDEYN